MKYSYITTRVFRVIFFLLISLGVSTVYGQEWLKALPQNKVETHQLTLKDYQKAFNTYWRKAQMKQGKIKKAEEYRDENLVKFKRWEWYWETRVDPKTGTFPTTTAWDVFKKYVARHPQKIQGNSNSNWMNLGPFETPGGYASLGRVNCVAFSPVDTNTLYVGTASGGVWKTTDLGGHWIPLGDFNMALGVADIVAENHGGQDIVYLGTGDKDNWATYSVGVLKSTDGGHTWNKTGLNWKYTDYGMIYRMLKGPNDDNTLYVATNKGLYKTTDAGVTFTLIDAHHFREIEFQPGSNTNMFAGDSWGGIFYSTDAGDNWTQVVDESSKNGGRVAIAVSADSANVVYGLIADITTNGLLGVYRSRDFGHTFQLVQDSINLLGWNCSGNDTGGQGWYDLVIVADPYDANTIYVGGVNNWSSNDGGKTWHLANHWSSTCNGKNAVVHADKHYMVFQPETNALFECNDGGIYKSNDGKNWTNLTNGMAISQIYRLGTSHTVPGEVITGLQDNGTKLFSGNSWNDVLGGDGMECLIDYTDAKTQYGEYYHGNIVRTNDHWQTDKLISIGLSGYAAWVTPYIIDPDNHNTLYIGFQDVFKTTDQGNSWTKISSWNGKSLNSLAIAPSDNKVVYAATLYNLYRTKDGGATWKNITGSLPVNLSSITYLTVKNDDPNTLWVTMGQFNNNSVYETTDGGTTWKDISAGLPAIPVNCIVQNKLHDPTELFIGTDLGVFVRKGDSAWQAFNDHLPHVVVDELEIHYGQQKKATLYAATFGRGLWTVDISGEINYKPSSLINNLRHYYKFDGNLNDSVGTVNGINRNVQINTSGKIHQCVRFEGDTSSYIETNNYSSFNFLHNGSDFSISVWEKHNSSGPSFNSILGNDVGGDHRGIFFNVDSTNVYFSVGTGNYPYPVFAHTWVSVLAPDTTRWNNLAITYDHSLDSNQYTLYVNGIKAGYASQINPSDTGNSMNPMRFGINKTTGTIQPFSGELDELAFWERTLNSSEISELYNSGKGLQYPFTGPTLTATFKADTLKGIPPLTVHFTDQSTGNLDSWFYTWDFGDGHSSHEKNPVHTYNSLGNFTISLTIYNNGDTSSQTKVNYIQVKNILSFFTADTLDGLAPLTVHFKDQSLGNPTSWAWDFNNDDTIDDTTQNPSWTYNKPGIYSVKLYVANNAYKDTLLKTGFIKVHVNIPDTNFRKVINERLGYTYPKTITHQPTTAEMASITDLDASNQGITNITGAEHLVNCITLSFDNNNIFSDNSVIDQNRHPSDRFFDKTGLRKSLADKNITLTFTRTNVQAHKGEINKIANFSPLAGLTRLQHLSLNNTGYSDVSFLSHLTNLQYLSLNRNHLSDISPLSNLTALQTLYLNNNNISEINSLSKLVMLSDLELDNIHIHNIQVVSNLIHLEDLSFSNDSISDISPLSNLINLNYLWAMGNQISNLSPIQNLNKLNFLGLSSNNISDASVLAGLTHLQELFLGNNPVSNLYFLNNMPQLTLLDISNLHLINLSSIANLSNLTYLNIDNNNLHNLKGIKNHLYIGALFASNNPLYDIRGIENLPLFFVDFQNCLITDFSPLLSNPHVMERIAYLYLAGNPASKEAMGTQITKLQAVTYAEGNWPSENTLAACYPAPKDGTAGIPDTASMSWQANFNNNDSVSYDLYEGEAAYDQPLVAQGLKSLNFNPELQKVKDYWWRVETISNGDTVRSGVWSFNTDTTPVITAVPISPTSDQSVTITFHAAFGDAGLKGFTGDVYANTGVITDKSASPSDWRYVKAAWNQNIPACKLKRIDTDVYQLKITPAIRAFYGVPPGEQILKLAFVFRSADGSKTGRMPDGGDIFYDVKPGVTQTISLNKGWDILSFYVKPDSMGMKTILQPLISSNELVKAMDEKGGFIQNISGTGWLNTIGDMASTEGYYIKLSIDDSLNATGDTVALPFGIPLQSGWNIMGYPIQKSQNAKAALQPLVDSSQFEKIINQSGGFIQYINGMGWINTIGNFIPGEGYYMKVKGNTTLTLDYPSSVKTSPSPANLKNSLLPHSKFFNKAFRGNPYYPMNIVVTRIQTGDYPVQPGDEVAAFDNGVCVGVSVVPDDITKPVNIVASFDDPTTEKKDGFTQGDEIRIQYMSSGLETPVDMNIDKLWGPPRFTPLETMVCGIAASPDDIKEHLGHENGSLHIYPNPAGGHTTFVLNNLKMAHVRIDIIDLNGKIVHVICNKSMDKGNYRFQYDASGLPAGIYDIRVIQRAVDKTAVRNYKLVITK